MRGYFHTHTMFQFQYELIFTCACKSCGSITNRRNLYTVLILFRFVRRATTILITCAYQIKAVCCLRTSLLPFSGAFLRSTFLHNILRNTLRICTILPTPVCAATSALLRVFADAYAFVLFCRSILNTQGKILLCANNNTIILPFKLINLYYKFAATGSKFDPIPRPAAAANRYFF